MRKILPEQTKYVINSWKAGLSSKTRLKELAGEPCKRNSHPSILNLLVRAKLTRYSARDRD